MTSVGEEQLRYQKLYVSIDLIQVLKNIVQMDLNYNDMLQQIKLVIEEEDLIVNEDDAILFISMPTIRISPFTDCRSWDEIQLEIKTIFASPKSIEKSRISSMFI
jgi:hypothetical protein